MWAPVPVVRLKIRGSRLASNGHSRWDAETGVVDLHDPGFMHFHAGDSIVANAAITESGHILDRIRGPYGEIRVGRIAAIQANEDGLYPEPLVPRFTHSGHPSVKQMRHSVILEPGWSRISAEYRNANTQDGRTSVAHLFLTDTGR